MDEESPPQQEGRESEGDTAAATKENEPLNFKEEIKEVLEKMEPLPGRISKLLRKHRARRRLTAADKLVLRYCEFIHVELSGMVKSLNQIYSLSEPLGPDYADEDLQRWLRISSELAYLIEDSLRESEEPAGCFSLGVARLPIRRLPLLRIFKVTESTLRYKYILGDGDDSDRTSITLHPYAAEAAGPVFLVGIEETLRNKQLKWFMADDGEPENKTLRVMSMVGPVGVGKTALTMEVYRQLQQIQGGHRFECCATAKVSYRPNMIEILKHILSQIVDKSEALAPDSDSSIQPSQMTMLQQEQERELLAREISQCLQDKR